MQIVVTDTETTGLDPAQGDTVVEIAWRVLEVDTLSFGEYYHTLLSFHGKMPPEAQAVHHIAEEELRSPGLPTRDAVIHSMLSAEEPGDMVYAAHNAPFDAGFLPELTLPWIDTYQCAKHVWPGAPSYKNQVLRYWRGLSVAIPDGLAPHRALADVFVTSEILLDMIRTLLERHRPEAEVDGRMMATPADAVQTLLRLSGQRVEQERCEFGKKYRGLPWKSVPGDYIDWILTKATGVDQDTLYNARLETERRRRA